MKEFFRRLFIRRRARTRKLASGFWSLERENLWGEWVNISLYCYNTEEQAWNELVIRGLVTREEIIDHVRSRGRLFQIPANAERMILESTIEQAEQVAKIVGKIRTDHEFQQHHDSTLVSCIYCGLPWEGFDPLTDTGCHR